MIALTAVTPAGADIHHLDDVIIDRSPNVGFDSVVNRGFGFDTVILSEHNLRILFEDTSSAESFPNNDWRLIANDSTNGGLRSAEIRHTGPGKLLRIGVTAGDTVDIERNLVVSGDCSEQNGACADYVFEPDYRLRSLEKLESLIAENGHLPTCPSAEEMRATGVNMTHPSRRLLEKIEELTLNTLQQQKMIKQLHLELERLEIKGD